MDRLERLLVEAERAACAELVRAVPCACFTLCIDQYWDGKFSGKLKLESPAGALIDTRKVTRHDSRCPEARAAAIEARGRRPAAAVRKNLDRICQGEK